MTPEGRQMVYETLVVNDIDALVVIGGNGTLWEQHFMDEFDIPVIGIPAP